MKKQVLDFNISIKQDEDGLFIASVPNLEGCYTQGNSLEEVMVRIKEAIELCVEDKRQNLTDTSLISEDSLAKEWLSDKENEAWKDL